MSGAVKIFFYNFFLLKHFVSPFALPVGPYYPPTKGEVWPKPAFEKKNDIVHTYFSNHFQVTVARYNCFLVRQAIERCKNSIAAVEDIAKKVRQFYGIVNLTDTNNDLNSLSAIRLFEIQLNTPCISYPQDEMDERYNITITNSARLSSDSIWGIIRGLETFSQLFYLSNDYKYVLINETSILDFPQYQHRGLMIDTARHYLSLGKILKTLDAMAMNKMNVLHWHMIDDSSFPYYSEKFPELSAKGAFFPSMVYGRDKIRTVVEYARRRGIRVMMEIDGPGHSGSWGVSHPEIMTECRDDAPLNPTKAGTYRLLGTLLRELQDIFPENYFHLGGDEVAMDCWKADPQVLQYMIDHHLEPAGIHSLYLNRVIPLLRKETVTVVWEDVFFRTDYFKSPSANKTIIQIWGSSWEDKMAEVLHKGMQVIFSSMWYLDYIKAEYEFQHFYAADPRTMMSKHINVQNLDNILGGEACMWGEMVDDTNVIGRVWPRTCAVAEVLWSTTDGKVPKEVFYRIEEQTCRMIRRGIPAEPGTGPGFCVTKHNVLPPIPLKPTRPKRPEGRSTNKIRTATTKHKSFINHLIAKLNQNGLRMG